MLAFCFSWMSALRASEVAFVAPVPIVPSVAPVATMVVMGIETGIEADDEIIEEADVETVGDDLLCAESPEK